MARRLALITGASSGIGLAFARVYAACGWDVFLTARREDRLQRLADEIRLNYGVEAHLFSEDLSDVAAPARLEQAVQGTGRTIDALINNAGYGLPDGFAGNPLEAHRHFLQVLLNAPTELAHRFVRPMLDQRFGRIINVASVAGFLPGSPTATLYGPVKSYLIRFSQGLHLELRDQGVHVTALCPGFTYSEFQATAGMTELSRTAPPWMWMGPDEVAREGYEAVEANRAVSVPGAPNKLAVAALNLLPDDWVMETSSRHMRRIRPS